MKKMKLYIVLFILNLILFSCTSDDTHNAQESNSNKLVKTEKIDANFKTDYTYNDDNRLITWTGTRLTMSYETNYVYDSNGNITESHYLQTSSNSTFSSDTYFEYNIEGKLISYNDVSLSYNGNIITATGTLAGNQNATIELETNNLGLIFKLSEIDKYTIFEYDTNGNLIVANTYDNSDVLLTTFNINYDQNINPFYGQMESVYIERFIEFFYPFTGVFVGGFEGYNFPFFANNIITVTENSNIFSNTIYTYDAENYPINVNQTALNPYQFDIEYYD